jgi:hypothetical protein
VYVMFMMPPSGSAVNRQVLVPRPSTSVLYSFNLVGSKPKPKSAFQKPGALSARSQVWSLPPAVKSVLQAIALGSVKPGRPELGGVL